jgi:hypothetical protein
VVFRSYAAFAQSEICEAPEEGGVKYVIRPHLLQNIAPIPHDPANPTRGAHSLWLDSCAIP